MSLITRVEVEGFMRLIAGAIDLDGVQEISGPNGSGKTSMLTAIKVGIEGADAAPAEPIHHGADQALVRMFLDDGTKAVRYIEPKKGGGHTWRIVLEPADGGRGRAITQRQLHDIIGEHRLDPTDFLSLKPAEKFAALQAFVPGVDFARSMADDDVDFRKRTDLNRDAKQARAAADLISVPADTPAVAIDEAALLQQLQEAHAQNALTVRRRDNRAKLVVDIAAMRTKAQGLYDGTQAALDVRRTLRDTRIADLEAQIVDLQKRITAERDQVEGDLEQMMVARQQEADKLTADADAEQKRLDGAEALPAIVDTDALAAKISEAKVINANVTRKAERTAHNQKAATYENDADALTAAMAARKKAREDAIAAAAIPIKGIEFGPGEIRLDGVPFDQASRGRQYTAAFEYCVGCNPALRMMWIRDASLLDDAAFAEVNRLSAEMNVRVLLETVRPIGGNVVILEAGKVKEVRRRKAAAA